MTTDQETGNRNPKAVATTHPSSATTKNSTRNLLTSVYSGLLAEEDKKNPEDPRRTQARKFYIQRIIARWEACSGVELGGDKKLAIIAELQILRATYPHLKMAEDLILRKTRFRDLTLDDFRPTVAELEKAGIDVGTMIARLLEAEFWRGFRAGKLVGMEER